LKVSTATRTLLPGDSWAAGLSCFGQLTLCKHLANLTVVASLPAVVTLVIETEEC